MEHNPWASDFGDEYTYRNFDLENVHKATMLLRRASQQCKNITSVIELGCNVGFNLAAMPHVFPFATVKGYDINKRAVEIARRLGFNAINHDITLPIHDTADLTFTRGVLIHIPPDKLPAVYDNLFNCSRRYIIISEYYNPTPVTVTYQGEDNLLFKRDFAGELLDSYPSLRLMHYFFSYHRDTLDPQGDLTTFILERT